MQAHTEATLSEDTSVEISSCQPTPREVISRCPQPDAECWKGTETILFVEDEAFVRKVTTEVLGAAGYRVLTAQNAEDAVQIYRRHSGEINLLLTDLVLPGETGRELALRLRRLVHHNVHHTLGHNFDHPLKVLFLTGYVEYMRVLDGEECLPKPFSTSSLLQKIRQVLDRSELAPAV
jgi:two-component system, cell cycle sensor histidine kinase and response regulator CckA